MVGDRGGRGVALVIVYLLTKGFGARVPPAP
jgi:hypothetical protein